MKLSGPLGSPIARPASNWRKAVAVVLFSIASATFLSAQTLVSIAVTPANPSFALGTTEQMTATGTFDDGSTLDITSSVTWTSQHPTIATVNSQGLATSVHVGNSRVTASLSGINGSTRLTITAAALVSIAVTPAMPSIALGMPQQFTATGTFTDGSSQNITTTVQWSSSAATVATISNAPGSNGLATSAGVGSTTITATSAAISGSTTLAVTAATLVSIAVTPATPSIALGTTQQFTATGTFTDLHTQNLTSTATWASNPTSTATISATGLATSLATGTATISATSGAITGSTVLTVTAAVLVSIAITPPDPTIALGAAQQFTATGTYSDGTTQNVTSNGHWTSSSGGVATISNSAGKQGLATSKSVGMTTIGVTLNAVSSTVILTVSPAALVSIAITPPTPTIPLGATEQFTATGTYSDGSTQGITSVVTWSSSAATVAIISNAAGSNGLATSAGVGTATITATSGAVSATTTLTIGTAALESLAITPVNPVLPAGATEQFTATATFTDGSTEDDTASVTWSSDAPSVASINTGGLATAIGTGVAHITAASASIKNSTTLTVTVPLAPVCSLQAAPASGKAPLAVTVTATCAAQTGTGIAATIITLGDGFYQSGATATHTFVGAGTFTVSVVATDSAGNTSKIASSTVSVTDAPSFFVGVSNGQIDQFDTSGNLLKTLNIGRGGSVTGMAFDALDALYVTDFTADGVSKFDGNGNLIGNFGSGYNCQPESIVFDQSGNAYVGETGCSHALLKFDPYGNLLAGSAVTTEVEGSDWIDLASDQCTIFYTSQGTTVFRFNACTGQQLPTFATGLHTGLGLRVLPDGGALVADDQDIVRLDSAGRTISTYNATGENCWVSLTLDPDGTSFWAVDFCSSDIVRFDITSGNQLAKFNAGTPTMTVYGIAMRGAPTATTAAGPLIATQQTPSVTAGQTASFALAFAPVSAALNQTFSFSCANLPIGAACSFSPPTAMATSSGVPPIQVTVSTTAAKASLRPSPFGHPTLYALCLLLPGMVLLRDIRSKATGKKLRRMTLVVLVVVLVVVLLSLLACGGGSPATTSTPTTNPTPLPPTPSSLATPAGTYSIVIQASSNPLVSSTVVSLTVH
jgi:PKD repeat protein